MGFSFLSMEINTIYNEDCLEGLKRISDNSIDCIISDPPYGMAYNRHIKDKKFNDIANDNSLQWLAGFFYECNRILKNNTAVYCFCSWHHIDKFKIEFEKYFNLKNILVWVKDRQGTGDLVAQYAPKYEFVLYGNKGKCPLKQGRFADVINAKKTTCEYHLTQKPVNLIEFLIQNSTNENDLILDPFIGSGTTAVACINTKRNFIGYELDKGYFETACKRVKNANLQLSLF